MKSNQIKSFVNKLFIYKYLKNTRNVAIPYLASDFYLFKLKFYPKNVLKLSYPL